MSSFEGKSVLIVDDSPNELQALRKLYSELGLNVVGEAKDGLEALAACEDGCPDIVSLDMIMPNMDGVECYRSLREKFPKAKFVFISALGSYAIVKENFHEELESYHFLSKPARREKLEESLEKVFSH